MNEDRYAYEMSEKRFTSFIEDDGYWIRDESDFKIIATGLKFGVAENLIAMLNELNDENDILKQQLQTRYIVNKQYEELQRLKKENEQLNELNEENQELKRLIKKMGELGGFNKHLIKTICGDGKNE